MSNKIMGYFSHSLSVSCFHIILGLPGPHFPSTCISKAVLTVPLERSACPYQRSLLSLRRRSRSSMPSHASSSLDLVLRLDTADLSDHCPVILLQMLEVWFCQWSMEHCALHTRAVHAATCLEREVAGKENW